MCVSHLIRALIFAFAALCASAVQSAEFLGLGFLPGGGNSWARGVSADGTVVVGASTDDTGAIQAFRWTEGDGMVGLGFLPGGMDSRASAASADGTVVVGWGESDIGDQAFRWTEVGGMAGLGILPGDTRSSATGVSTDGTVVVGWSFGEINHSHQAFRWTEANGLVGLDHPPGVTSSEAYGVSADGTVVVGKYSDIGTQAFRWTEADGMVGLGHLPGRGNGTAYGVSGDGSVVVGTEGVHPYNPEAFRWTEAGGMESLGYLPGGTSSWSDGVSADGSVIVGVSRVDNASFPENTIAFRWTEVGGMESIPDLLSSSGIDMTAWYVHLAFDVSKDGSVIVGDAIEDDHFWQGYIADLGDIPPQPANTIDISGSVKTTYDADVCAMVLAGGKHIFSCNPPGEFSLTDIPRESNGTVKRQIYADGFFLKIDILSEDSDDVVVMSHSGTCPSYNTPYDPGFFPDAAGNWIDVSGTVLLQDTQTLVCAMVLANGQYMFSCDGTGGYDLTIPLDNNGQFKLQVYADGFAPAIQTFDEFSLVNDVWMARAAECQ